MLRRNAGDLAIFTWLVVVLLGLVVLVRYGSEIANALGQIAAAIIGAGGVLLAAIVTHFLTQMREQQLEEHRTLKKNYMDILERIETLIRTRKADGLLSVAFLQSCVVGSQNVILKAKEVLEADGDTKRSAALRNLVDAMRADVGLPEIYIEKFPPIFPARDEGSFQQ